MSKELLVKLNEVVSYLERSGANPTQIVLALTVRDAIGELRQAEAELERAGIVLRDNMALANSQAREHRTERDSIIKELRKRYSAIEIADMAGLTRQRVHQILKEPPIPIMKPDRLALIEENEQLRAEAIAAEADLSDERAKNEMAEHKLVVEREALKADLVKARAAIIAMALDGWLYHGPEGMSDAQEKCLAAYNETDHGKAALAKHKL